MQDLIRQERFGLEVLDKLNSKKLLNNLVFGGGSMLRLCFGLNRFSVDLDFWIIKKIDINLLFKNIHECLSEFYAIKYATNKFSSLVFEIRSQNYPRSLKMEIRKETKKVTFERAIAYSKHSSIQVLINVVSLKEMMDSKIEAFLERKEIWDVFDIEFLFKKGIILDMPSRKLKGVLDEIDSLTKRDYTVKLGSLLDEGERKYYITENFKLLRLAIAEKIKSRTERRY